MIDPKPTRLRPLICGVLVALLVLCLASAVPIAPAGSTPRASQLAASDVSGAWVADDDSGDAWLFEAMRAVRGGAPQPRFLRAQWHEAGVTLESWGIQTTLGLEREGDALWITEDDTRRRFERADGMPETLKVRKPQLADRTEQDQAVREQMASATDETSSLLMHRMSDIDVANTAWLMERLAEVGWFDAERFGAAATGNAFLLVQHSGDLGLMTVVLPLIQKDVVRGAVRGDQFALLYDRLTLNLGGLQSFGSQLSSNGGRGLFVCPLADPEGVDVRRAAVGMGPLRDDLELFRADNGGELPRTLDGRSFEDG